MDECNDCYELKRDNFWLRMELSYYQEAHTNMMIKYFSKQEQADFLTTQSREQHKKMLDKIEEIYPLIDED